MKFKGLDLNLLVALDMLLTERSVTQASERLHLTQSAVSSSLARLRESFSNELLVQSGKKMILTPFAEILHRQVRDILTTIEAAMHSNPAFRPEESQRHFRIATSDFVTDTLLTKVHKFISHTAPDVRLYIEQLSNEAFDLLRRGDIDLIIAPDYYLQANSLLVPLFSDPWVCIAWEENKSIGKTIDLEQYQQMDHVILEPRNRVAFDQIFMERENIFRKVKAAAPLFSSLVRLVVGTNRIATVPSRAIATCALGLPLKVAQPVFGIPPLKEAMQWHQSRNHDLAFTWLREVISATAQVPLPMEVSKPDKRTVSTLPKATREKRSKRP